MTQLWPAEKHLERATIANHSGGHKSICSGTEWLHCERVIGSVGGAELEFDRAAENAYHLHTGSIRIIALVLV